MTALEKLDKYPLLDSAILRHGYAPIRRDYDLIVQPPWEPPRKGTYLYRFTHCPIANCTTKLRDSLWKLSWSDLFVDPKVWESAGSPEGHLWVPFSVAYPGVSYVQSSKLAKEWTDRFEKEMHHVLITTESYEIELVFHDILVKKLDDDSSTIDPINITLGA